MNNSIYEDEAETWWDPNGFLYAMGSLLNAGRSEYFIDVLKSRGINGLRGINWLDVGCGGGSLCEIFARSGANVTGVDQSEQTIIAARKHASSEVLDIRYEVGSAEDLPLQSGIYDVVSCCELLEHVSRPDAVVREIARMLRPGGLLFFATPNRTPLSKLLLINVLQDWHIAAVLPPKMHVAERLIKPSELDLMLQRQALAMIDHVGLVASPLNIMKLAPDYLRLRLDKTTFPSVARRVKLQRSRITALMYMGYAIKTG